MQDKPSALYLHQTRQIPPIDPSISDESRLTLRMVLSVRNGGHGRNMRRTVDCECVRGVERRDRRCKEANGAGMAALGAGAALDIGEQSGITETAGLGDQLKGLSVEIDVPAWHAGYDLAV